MSSFQVMDIIKCTFYFTPLIIFRAPLFHYFAFRIPSLNRSPWHKGGSLLSLFGISKCFPESEMSFSLQKSRVGNSMLNKNLNLLEGTTKIKIGLILASCPLLVSAFCAVFRVFLAFSSFLARRGSWYSGLVGWVVRNSPNSVTCSPLSS